MLDQGDGKRDEFGDAFCCLNDLCGMDVIDLARSDSAEWGT